MRTVSSAVANRLSQKFGLESTVFIGVTWGTSGESYYSGTEFKGARKSVVQLGGLETTQRITGSGVTQSVTVTLSDTDGHLSLIMDTIDIHKRPAKVYLGFDNIKPSQAVTLIDGEINSEMKWDDQARTLTFTIVNKIEGRQFGFAMEDGYFAKVNENDRSKAWPFRFGETCAYPAVKVANGVQGILRVGQGVADPTLDAQLCQAENIVCPQVPVEEGVKRNTVPENSNLSNAIRGWENSDPFAYQPDARFGLNIMRIEGEGSPYTGDGTQSGTTRVDPRCEHNKFKKMCQLLRDRANQLVYVEDALTVYGGEEFPQDRTITIMVDDVEYTGVMSGETFTIETTNRLDQPSDNPSCTGVGDYTLGYRGGQEQQPGSLEECSEPTANRILRVVGGAGEAWRNLGEMDSSGFKWLPAGTNVVLAESTVEVNVVSLIPGTVDGVFAYRRLGDQSVLTELPTDYYEVVTTDYGDLQAVEVHLVQPLTSWYDENWSAQVYVAFTSDVGPNPIDALEWIIENYTDYTHDTTTFDAVKTKLANYPCNYYHAKKEDVLVTMQRIAYEARCALIITDNVVKIKYLSPEPAADKTFTESDIVDGSFGFSMSRTEELITSQGVTWQPWGADALASMKVTRTFRVENNIEKYGFFDSEDVYETINNEAQAIKTATFWSIRNSNTWKEVFFTTTLEHMDLELYDCIELNISPFPNVKTSVKSMTVNPENGTVDFVCWTPVLSGSDGAYIFAWPGDIDEIPYPDSSIDVPAPPISITPPEDHPLFVPDPNPIVPAVKGDRFPTDYNDVYPELLCPAVTEPELIDEIEPQFNRIDFLDYEAEAVDADEKGGNGLNFSAEDTPEIEVCGRPSLEACVYEVTVQYASATSIATGTGSGFDCDIQPGACTPSAVGARCGGPSFFLCKTFGSKAMATAYVGVIESQIERGYCKWTNAKQGPIGVVGPKGAGADCSGDNSIDVQTGGEKAP
ncbi:MAG: hypothetical protein GY906_04705 [bacterium]|nr:hypothetical protein [bacterium]